MRLILLTVLGIVLGSGGTLLFWDSPVLLVIGIELLAFLWLPNVLPLVSEFRISTIAYFGRLMLCATLALGAAIGAVALSERINPLAEWVLPIFFGVFVFGIYAQRPWRW